MKKKRGEITWESCWRTESKLTSFKELSRNRIWLEAVEEKLAMIREEPGVIRGSDRKWERERREREISVKIWVWKWILLAFLFYFIFGIKIGPFSIGIIIVQYHTILTFQFILTTCNAIVYYHIRLSYSFLIFLS